jgi:hypothetical protein
VPDAHLRSTFITGTPTATIPTHVDAALLTTTRVNFAASGVFDATWHSVLSPSERRYQT